MENYSRPDRCELDRELTMRGRLCALATKFQSHLHTTSQCCLMSFEVTKVMS
jgi:hypothetical protein